LEWLLASVSLLLDFIIALVAAATEVLDCYTSVS